MQSENYQANLTEVTKDDFFNIIGTLDVMLRTEGDYPYTTVFSLKHGEMIEKIVRKYGEKRKYPIISNYYIAPKFLSKASE